MKIVASLAELPPEVKVVQRSSFLKTNDDNVICFFVLFHSDIYFYMIVFMLLLLFPFIAVQLLKVSIDYLLNYDLGTLLDGQPILNLPPKTINLSKVDFSVEERSFYTKLESDSKSQFKVLFLHSSKL